MGSSLENSVLHYLAILHRLGISDTESDVKQSSMCSIGRDERLDGTADWENVDDENMKRARMDFESTGRKLLGVEKIKANPIKAMKAKMKATKAKEAGASLAKTVVTRAQAKKATMENNTGQK